MIKEALEYLASIQTPLRQITHVVDGQPYRVSPDGTLGAAVLKVDPRPVRPTLTLTTIGAGTTVEVADDGMTQVVTVKTGAVTRGTVPLPSDGVDLIPHRTFREANPVEAKFLLRMKGVKDALPKIALIEIDPMWKLYLVGSIRKYLEEKLPGATIIA
jgi:hypothetical protein